MNELTTWLAAQIAEDERVARDAQCSTTLPPIWDTGMFYGPSGPASEHIAHWDPARVLAECEAKRAIVELHSAVTSYGEVYCIGCHFANDEEYLYLVDECPTKRAMAIAYADRPGYREEWRP